MKTLLRYRKAETRRLNAEPNDLLPAGEDFIFKQLFEHGSTKVVFSCAVLLICILPLIVSIFEGTFINRNLKIDAIHDLGYFVLVFFILFFVIFIPYYFNDFSKAITLLGEKKILNINDPSYKNTLDYSNALFSNKLVTILPYLLAILFTIFGCITFYFAGLDYWDSSAGFQKVSLSTILVLLPRLLFAYFIAAFLLRLLLIYFVLKKLINENIDIQPLHPDNCGGLSPLGKFSVKISLAGFGIGIPLMFNIIWDINKGLSMFGYVEMSTILIYIFALTIVFFLPLLGARDGMLKAKRKEIIIISEQYQIVRKRVFSNIDRMNSTHDQNISKLEELKRLHDMAKSMPVYPFNANNVIRFFSSILWPILLILINYFIEKL